MTTKLRFLMISAVTLGLAGSFNGCTCNAEAEMGKAAPATPATPPPPPAPPPPAPPPPAPVAAVEPTPAPPAHKIIPIGKVNLEGNKVKIPGELEFDTDKSTLKDTPQSKEILGTLVEFMKQNPTVTKLRVEGHTDNQGTADHNIKLSQERADAVKKYLGDHGIDTTRLSTQGYGQTHPVVDNDSAEHKALNRRTEFHIQEIDGKAVDSPAPAPAADAKAAAPATPAAVKAEKKAEAKKAEVKAEAKKAEAAKPK